MAIQLLRLLSLCCLLATAFGAGEQQAPSSPPSHGGGTYCYKTVVRAPKLCALEFIEAIATGGNKKFISEVCCEYLVCVHEDSCVEKLRRICSPKAMASKCEGFYPPPPPPATAMAN